MAEFHLFKAKLCDVTELSSSAVAYERHGTKVPARDLKEVKRPRLEQASVIHRESNERIRIERVIAKEGVDGAIRWARRTAGIYRAAVLDRSHFAHAGACRRQFIQAYLELKRFAGRGSL